MVNVQLKTGERLAEKLHANFAHEVEWRGRCINLSKADKQNLPVSQASRPFAVLMVHHYETGRPVYSLRNSLPFGASSSVFGLNRASRGLWFVGSTCCKLLGGVLFDDFPLLEPQPTCTLATKSFERNIGGPRLEVLRRSEKDSPFRNRVRCPWSAPQHCFSSWRSLRDAKQAQ